MKNFFFIVLVVSFFPIASIAQMEIPKREFRGAWVATVENLDWPSNNNLTISQQKDELIEILDALKYAGINAVIFQIRPACDALYQSDIEPWSYWLSGQQGRSPGNYDPLQFAIIEAHKRGMELHAWFNPYRAEVKIDAFELADNHVVKTHPEWILTFNKVDLRMLNPGLPQVRKYVTDVVLDAVNRYDIDGVHFDDYFYPYPDSDKNFYGISSEDNATFNNYSRGFTNKDNWRRDNVNLLVEQIYDSIQAVKPWVKFGISPFGIWKNGVPEGIVGLSAYHDIYCDARAWLDAKTVDYITPQCYWKIGGDQDYASLVSWWASVTQDRHLYVGQIFSGKYTSSELPNQVELNRQTDNLYGNILFRATHILSNTFGFTEFLANDFHRYPALISSMAWKDSIAPHTIQSLRYESLPGQSVAGLTWDLPQIATDGDSMSKSVIYRFSNDQIIQSDLLDPSNILEIGDYNNHIPQTPSNNGPYYYVVTALDRNWNESLMSDVLMIPAPDPPLLQNPVNLAIYQRDSTKLTWKAEVGFTSFHLQVSEDSLFSDKIVFEKSELQDTSFLITNLQGQDSYFWRVKMVNAGGFSDFSDIFSFTTGPFPDPPLLAFPEHRSRNTPLEITFNWHRDSLDSLYRFQIATSNAFENESIVYDSSGIGDTLLTVDSFSEYNTYYWRVKAYNQYGYSGWSNDWRFRTGSATDINPLTSVLQEYDLKQNCPNPFNPVTIIEFSLAFEEFVKIKVFDIRGKLIKILIEESLPAGLHHIHFDGSRLASGVYFYNISAGEFNRTKKMILVK